MRCKNCRSQVQFTRMKNGKIVCGWCGSTNVVYENGEEIN